MRHTLPPCGWTTASSAIVGTLSVEHAADAQGAEARIGDDDAPGLPTGDPRHHGSNGLPGPPRSCRPARRRSDRTRAGRARWPACARRASASRPGQAAPPACPRHPRAKPRPAPWSIATLTTCASRLRSKAVPRAVAVRSSTSDRNGRPTSFATSKKAMPASSSTRRSTGVKFVRIALAGPSVTRVPSASVTCAKFAR